MVTIHYPTLVRSLRDALNPEEFNAYLSTITPETVFKGPVDEVVGKTSAYLDSLGMHKAASAVISWGEGLEEVFNSSPSGRILWIH